LSRDELRVLAEEQAALRRVATLVARGVPPEEVIAAATEEVGQLLPVEFALMGRYETDDTIIAVAAWGAPVAGFPVGRRWGLGGKNLVTIVRETGRPARIDRYADSSSGSIGAVGRESGFNSTVGAPITVEGQLWGLIAVGSRHRDPPLPAGTEERLAHFTELLATAIANSESRARLARLGSEQAALRRLATLVARGTAPEEVFTAVTEEVVRVLPVNSACMGRYESDGTVTFVAVSGMAGWVFPTGPRLVLEGTNASTVVAQTGRAARIDNYADASGPIGDAFRVNGVRSAIGIPITVEGHLWGVMVVGSGLGERMPADTEERLAQFTELLATAVANAESRAGLARLADEQAALRRVATLVAQGIPPEDVFATVTEEVAGLFLADLSHMCRYESDGSFTVVAGTGARAQFPVGSRWPLEGKNMLTMRVLETGRPARINSYADATGALASDVRAEGIRSSVGAPVIVEGRLWGLVAVSSIREQPFRADTEARLGSFTELVATAIANTESHAALAASRARIVAAADESRRRIERDLHDGAQQRLVHAVIVLKLAQGALARADPNSEELVAEALRHAEQANAELRELAHGILPAALTRGGLSAGVEALVSRFPLPVSVDMTVERLPAGVEATAYFVVSEALTNVVKHSRASGAAVTAQVRHGHLRVEIRDDGIGGAGGSPGTGLGGLADRISALDGRLVLESPPGGGTRVCALLPISEQDRRRPRSV
jgi:signal transduction histidine kinase